LGSMVSLKSFFTIYANKTLVIFISSKFSIDIGTSTDIFYGKGWLFLQHKYG
jgi:hypothetical protein